MRAALKYAPSILVLALMIAVWEGAARAFAVPDWLLPPPTAVAAALASETGSLLEGALVTLGEVAIGFALASARGFALACALAWSGWLERGLYPLVIGITTLPVLAITPQLVVWFGLGIGSKIAVIALIAFFPIVVNLFDGLRSAERGMVDMFRLLGASRWQIFVKLRLPGALPQLFTGLKLAAVASVIGAVVGEWIGGSAGLGYIIKLKGVQIETDVTFAAIALLMVMSTALFVLVKAAEGLLLRRYPQGG